MSSPFRAVSSRRRARPPVALGRGGLLALGLICAAIGAGAAAAPRVEHRTSETFLHFGRDPGAATAKVAGIAAPARPAEPATSAPVAAAAAAPPSRATTDEPPAPWRPEAIPLDPSYTPPKPASAPVEAARSYAATEPAAREPDPTPSRASFGRAFANCAAARAAGRSNIPRGDQAYASHLDRDDDGIACESGFGGRTTAKRGHASAVAARSHPFGVFASPRAGRRR